MTKVQREALKLFVLFMIAFTSLLVAIGSFYFVSSRTPEPAPFRPIPVKVHEGCIPGVCVI